jgi:retinol dehydrogenase-14
LKRYTGGKTFKAPAGSALGKTIIITGANTGIGKETAFRLAQLNARVILACRDTSKGDAALKDIRRWTKDGDLVVKQLDLASFKSIRTFVEEMKKEERIDVLINNAAVFQCPYSRTQDGLEMQMGVNYFGPFLLTNLLIEKMKSSRPSRVVVVSSGLARNGKVDLDHLLMDQDNYDLKAGYNNSKLACNYFSRELAKKLENDGVGVHFMSPGMVRTDLGRHKTFPLWMKIVLAPFWFLLVKSPYQRCQTVLYCTLSEELEGQSGKFYRNCGEGKWPEEEIDPSIGPGLWRISARMVGL